MSFSEDVETLLRVSKTPGRRNISHFEGSGTPQLSRAFSKLIACTWWLRWASECWVNSCVLQLLFEAWELQVYQVLNCLHRCQIFKVNCGASSWEKALKYVCIEIKWNIRSHRFRLLLTSWTNFRTLLPLINGSSLCIVFTVTCDNVVCGHKNETRRKLIKAQKVHCLFRVSDQHPVFEEVVLSKDPLYKGSGQRKPKCSLTELGSMAHGPTTSTILIQLVIFVEFASFHESLGICQHLFFITRGLQLYPASRYQWVLTHCYTIWFKN